MACQIVLEHFPKLMYNTMAKMCHFSNLYRPTYKDLLESIGTSAQWGVTTTI